MLKVREIIRENFDLRTESMVIAYLMDKGITFCSELTEEDIATVVGNGLMTKEFTQALVRTASKIAKECSLFDDIIPYIVMEMPNNKGFNYHRLSEIASRAIDGLREDDEYEAREYLKNEIELDEDEAEYFGIDNLYDEED